MSGLFQKHRPSWVGDIRPKPRFEKRPIKHEIAIKILEQFDSDYVIKYSLSENSGPTGHFKVQNCEGFFVLIIKHGCDPSSLKLVGSITGMLNNQGVSVLPFIKTRSGESFAHYQGFWGTLVKYVEGRHADYTVSDVKKIATLLSKTHVELQQFPVSRMAKKLTSQLNDEFELSLKYIRENKPMADHFCFFKDLISDAEKKCDIRYSNHRDAQMLHGDLSPGNIIFDANNEPFLIDFEDSVYSYRPKIHDYGMAALRFALCGGLGSDGSTPHERVVCFSKNYFCHGLVCSTNLSHDMLQVAANMVINLCRVHDFNGMFIVGEWNKARTLYNIASNYHRP